VKSSRKKLIIALSIVIPLVVASLFNLRIDTDIDFHFLPRIYSGINFLTFILLISALIAIKKGNKKLHQGLIKICISFTTLFLILYIIYHSTTDSTAYGGEGILRSVYFFILISHITLSVTVIPLVLISLNWAIEGDFKKHKRIARIAMPIWMYVALTGVIVYLMISPFYT
jgi:putative membrane protein